MMTNLGTVVTPQVQRAYSACADQCPLELSGRAKQCLRDCAESSGLRRRVPSRMPQPGRVAVRRPPGRMARSDKRPVGYAVMAVGLLEAFRLLGGGGNAPASYLGPAALAGWLYSRRRSLEAIVPAMALLGLGAYGSARAIAEKTNWPVGIGTVGGGYWLLTRR